MKIRLLVLLAGVASIGFQAPAHAIGCLSGGLAGAVAGHVAHHGVLGAIGGCVAGHAYNKHQKQQMQMQRQTNQSPSFNSPDRPIQRP